MDRNDLKMKIKVKYRDTGFQRRINHLLRETDRSFCRNRPFQQTPSNPELQPRYTRLMELVIGKFDGKQRRVVVVARRSDGSYT